MAKNPLELAYAAGMQAAKRGDAENDNPYSDQHGVEEGRRWSSWVNGWRCWHEMAAHRVGKPLPKWPSKVIINGKEYRA